MLVRLILIGLTVAACGDVVSDTPGDAGDSSDTPDADECEGTCECVVDSDCDGAHMACNDQGASRTCECAAGYTASGGGCTWSGVVGDPEFQSPARWVLATGTTIDPDLNVSGMVEPGAARFTDAGLCNLGRITQAFEMPRYATAEPLVAQITYRYVYDFVGPVVPARPAFGLGDAWQDQVFGTGNPWSTARVCLGGAQYAKADSRGRGGIVELTIAPNMVTADCSVDGSSLDVDHFEVVPANPGECPVPGEAANGDAEDTSGWTFSGGNFNGDPVSMMIEAGVGEAGTKGVRLFARNRCSTLNATTRISIPSADAMPSPALAVYTKVSSQLQNGVFGRPRLAEIDLPALSAAGAEMIQKVCVPAPLRGAVWDYVGTLDAQTLACSEVVNASAIFDSVKLVNEPGCGTDPAIADPGFESGLALIGAEAQAGRSIVRTIEDPGMVNSGTHALQLSVTQLCSQARWTTRVVVPASNASAGPALRFFYKATPADKYTFRVAAAVGADFTPVLDNQFHEGTICLDPKLSGRAQSVIFEMSRGSGTCATTHPAEGAIVDDLMVTLRPACPR